MRQLLSKLIAAAISAAVVLLWWPIIMTSDGPASWALRAVAWTLLFEIVLALLGPIEDTIWQHVQATSRFAARLFHVRQRVYAPDATPKRRAVSHVGVALLVAAVPLGLVIGGPAPEKPRPVVIKREGKTKVVRITKVIRVEGAPAAAPNGAAPIKRQSAEKPSAKTKRRTTKTKAPAPKPQSDSGATNSTGAPDSPAAQTPSNPPASG